MQEREQMNEKDEERMTGSKESGKEERNSSAPLKLRYETSERVSYHTLMFCQVP
jgi:hypothetical protein